MPTLLTVVKVLFQSGHIINPKEEINTIHFFQFYRSLKTGHLKVTAAMNLLLEIGLLHVKAGLLCAVGEAWRQDTKHPWLKSTGAAAQLALSL